MVDVASPVVTACSRAAWVRGVRPGMVASVARGHAPELVTLVRDLAGELELLRALGDRLLGLAPVVDLGGPPRGQHHAMVVEVPAGKRGATFGARLVEAFQERGLHVRVGIADDRFTAAIAASSGDHDGAVTCVPRGGSAAFLAPLPLALLALPAEVQHMLECLGVRTLGAFADLPPPSVARAWDADLQALARGDSGGRLDPYVPPPRLHERVHVDGRLGAAVQAVADRVIARLGCRGGATAQLALGLGAGAPIRIEIDGAMSADELGDALARAIGSATPLVLDVDVTTAADAPLLAPAVPPPPPLVLTAVPSVLGDRPEHRRTRRGKQRPRIAPGQARLFTSD
ncbi:MAG: hypothetical protein IPL61_04650 [Myxococcales bacterium]|nr:hypothetical protein [Myxococcales bacterium]